jgi:hypothetical protein
MHSTTAYPTFLHTTISLYIYALVCTYVYMYVYSLSLSIYLWVNVCVYIYIYIYFHRFKICAEADRGEANMQKEQPKDGLSSTPRVVLLFLIVRFHTLTFRKGIAKLLNVLLMLHHDGVNLICGRLTASELFTNQVSQLY